MTSNWNDAVNGSQLLFDSTPDSAAPETNVTLDNLFSLDDSSAGSLENDMASKYLKPNQLLSTSQHDWILNPSTGQVTDSFSSTPISKRSRMDNDDADLNACWKSPLCPNRKTDGSHPDACQGECVDFLFAHPSSLPDDKKILSDLMARSQPKISLENNYEQTKTRKRVEMDSPPDSTGRATSAGTDKDLIFSKSIDSQSSSPTDQTLFKQSDPKAATSLSKPKGRVPHNQVEKKYRENVNTQFEALRRALPLSQNHLVDFMGIDGFGLDIEDLASAAAARQPSKAVVLSSATAYIKMLERENSKIKEEMEQIKTQNRALQSLVGVKCDGCSLMDYFKRLKIQGGAVV